MSEAIQSRPYVVGACCERCVFGRGRHADWCEAGAFVRYICAGCGGEFTSDWPDEDATLEVARVFGAPHRRSDAVVCDDCYRRVRGQLVSAVADGSSR